MSPNSQNPSLKNRPPIVVILGHVDHGKTSILDSIRKSKVAEYESGGITQHIGAYQIEHQGKTITFIDTPGHEAFSAMRSRGAKVADMAILVVAGDEGVKPQTKEAIDIIQKLGLPLIVAINKMDKPNVLPDKVKKELADRGVLVESLGGQVPAVMLSAKTGIGIADILDMMLLVADIEDIKGDYNSPANGIIIESRLDPRRGATATLLIRDGLLTSKDIVAAESAYGQIKVMEDFLGRHIDKAEPSTPVLITGFNSVPPVGEEWQVMRSIDEAKNRAEKKGEAEKRKREQIEFLDIKEDQKVLNIILKADFSGSFEAIREALKTIPQDEVIIRVIKGEVGDINENDVKLAHSAKAKIYGFRVKSTEVADKLAQRDNIRITLWQIIYELIQAIRHDASVMLSPEIIKEKQGRLRILATFKQDGRKQIIGGRVASGKIKRGALADIFRDDEFIGNGKITQLQINKQSAAEAQKDKECGLLFESDVTVERNDILETYEEQKHKREL